MNKLSFALFCLAVASQSNAKSNQDFDNDTANKYEERLSGLEQQFESSSRQVSLGGRLQIDFNGFNGAYNADNGGDFGAELFPRRARLSVDGERTDLEYKMILEFAEDTIEILLLRFEYVGFDDGPVIKFGKIREDISLDALTSSKHMALIERASVANTMSPYFRWGVSANQYFPTTGLRYAFGIYKNDAFGANGKDTDGALALAASGRLTWNLALDHEQLFHAGGWSSYREFGDEQLNGAFARAEIREPNVRLVDYSAGGQLVRLDYLSQHGFEAAWQNGPLLIQGEYAERRISTSDTSSELNRATYAGYYIQASYMLTGEHKFYSTSSARFNQPKGVANAWEIAVRASSMDATSDLQGTRAQSYTLGVSYYIDEDTKIMVNGIRSSVSGPGTLALVNTNTEGNAITARFHYDF
ncbi:OprO/OprP family phosphate-selective porin [Salinimonas iocasae]|uniref:Porin n=1 Tax=Salinimonas iocasae TaxID=2572577 RepID=A0A5B7YDL0_9ALTE|nr:porin [Salinimonas iocasae]QCZ93363.1 porin [Salinimonas iocasae]